MATVNVLNREGSPVGEIELNDNIFMSQINVPVMHQAVRVYLNSQRRGTHAVKNRAAVSGGGKKPWRQKGTGRASFGSSRNPVWRGGGVAFGPTVHSHDITMPKKMRRAALLSALSSKLAEGKVIVLDELSFDAPKTKEFARVMNNIDAANALVVLAADNGEAALSARNIPGIEAVRPDGLNTYNVLYHDKLVLTKDALAAFEEVYA
ncbi:MAG: 50S ribosomal protein L4 [Firmicutes bacterium]|nr:50S ribosomal protein L4 [Bacillota bacterium]MBQ6606524.1 50S ribosomal protein L4 [Bacillota bacterium]